MIELHVLYMHKALLTSGVTDIHSQLYLRAYSPPDKKGGEGQPSHSWQRAVPSALPFISTSQTHYLLPQGRCQHRVEDKDQREHHAQDVLSSSEEGHSG